MIIKRATVDDVYMVVEILQSAADWLESRGMVQWTKIDPGGLKQAVIEHEVFLAHKEDIEKPVGTVRVQWRDDQFWGEASGTVGAGYIHRLAVRPEFTGHGIGREILAWAEGHMRQNGKRISRLDCAGDNPRLIRFYIDAGYTLVDQIMVGPFQTARFKKTLG